MLIEKEFLLQQESRMQLLIPASGQFEIN